MSDVLLLLSVVANGVRITVGNPGEAISQNSGTFSAH